MLFLHYLNSLDLNKYFNFAFHRHAVAQPCVNGDRLSKGRMAKFDPAQIRNPSTDRHKIWNMWLRRRDDSLRKISCKSVHWGLLGKWVKYNENFSPLYIYLFCWPTYWSDCPADFHTRWLKRRGLTQGSNLFRNQNSKLISNPQKIPQSRKFGPKTDLEIFGQKRSYIKISPINGL